MLALRPNPKSERTTGPSAALPQRDRRTRWARLYRPKPEPDCGHEDEPYRVFRRVLILEGWSHDQAHTPVFS